MTILLPRMSVGPCAAMLLVAVWLADAAHPQSVVGMEPAAPASEKAGPPQDHSAAVQPLPVFARAEDRLAFGQALHRMLREGFDRGRDGLPTARRHYAAALALTQREPRLHYGYGLALLKNLKYDEAAAQFQRAVECSDSPYWPAWQALIRLRLVRNEIEPGLERLILLAHRLTVHGEGRPEDVRCAAWLGRMIGYLHEPDNEITGETAAVARADRHIEQVLGHPLLDHYRRGKDELRAEYAQAVAATGETLAELTEEQREKRAEELQELALQQEQRKDRTEKLELTAEQWQEWIDDQIRRHDEQLAKLTRSFSQLQQQGQVVMASVLRINGEIGDLELRQNPRKPSRNLRQAIEAKAAVRDQLQAQYTVLDRQAAAVRQKGAAVLAGRQAAVARYQTATGQLVAQSDTLRKWGDQLSKKQRANETETAATPQTRALQRQVHALGTYFPFDPDTERQRLLDSLPAFVGQVSNLPEKP